MCSFLHILLSTSNGLTGKLNEVEIKNSQSKKLPRITIDNDLKFEDHINMRKSKCQNECFFENSPIYRLAEKKANNKCIL